jgi:hypothetical protein
VNDEEEQQKQNNGAVVKEQLVDDLDEIDLEGDDDQFSHILPDNSTNTDADS